MDFKEIFNKVITPENDKVNKKWYLAPLIPAVLWIIFSIISLFTIDPSVLLDPFVIVSIVTRFLLPLFSILFIKRFYITGKLNPLKYNHILNFVGYSVSLTYVSYILPGVVLDFYKSGVSSFVFTLFVVISTLCPMALYLLLKNPNVKLASSYFTQVEIDKEKKMKKDKKLKKTHQKSLRKQRTFLQNLWFEILDPLMWAILWVLIINSTLFQLYQIPSSSMVPEFLEKDRVVASKLFSGPKLPLTKYEFPQIGNPKAGDIVTFNNPKVDDPTSDLHYKNVFTRIFQPFVFMLSFSKLDIDSGFNGEPKARQLVKRVIAVPGEKLCIVNDNVYKKVEDGTWTIMSEIQDEKEWGHNDLFSIDNKNSGAQIMNPALRSELDEAALLALDSDLSLLKTDLERLKSELLYNLDNIDANTFVNALASYNRKSSNKVNQVLIDIETSYRNMMQVNRSGVSVSSKNNMVDDFEESLERYTLFTMYEKITDLSEILLMDRKIIKDELKIDLTLPSNASPYDEFVVKLDGIIKLKSLMFYNQILSTGEIDVQDDLLRDIKLLSIYTSGLQLKSRIEPFSFYAAGNLPEYPVGENNYIPKGEYFLLGDNRYNSLDSRLGDDYYEIPLNPNGGEFSNKLTVSWAPHTIGDEYIHGKVSFILFPFDHFKIF